MGKIRLILTAIILCLGLEAVSQDNDLISSNFIASSRIETSFNMYEPDLSFLKDLKTTKLMSIRTADGYFNKTFLVGDDGPTYSTSYMPSEFFLPNDNLIVVTGQDVKRRDSFNPYGARDMTSAIILSTFNSFITRLKLNRR